MSGAARSLALAGFLGAAFVLAFRSVDAPDEAPDPGVVERLAWIAAEPHPTGTEASARVRAGLVGELERLGLEVELQRAEVDPAELEVPERVRERLREALVGEGDGGEAGGEDALPPFELVNVLARVEGTRGGDGAALLMAHYDSRPGAPGAGDNGAAVAALLDAFEDLLADGGRPENDLIVLFDDAEELGLLGARRFASEHRWTDDVRAVFNFEGRGNGGPSILFETGPGSGALVEAFAARAPDPVGTSLAPAVYRRLPNDTSFTVFRDRLPGLNFAYVGGPSAYHRPTDTVENLRPSTLAHQTAAVRTCLAIASSHDLAADPWGDPVFFDIAGLERLGGPGLVRYGPAWNLALTVVALLAAFVAVRGMRPDARGALHFALVTAGGVWVTWWIVWWGIQAVAWLGRVLGLLEQAAGRGNLESSRLCALALVAVTADVAAGRVRRLVAKEPPERADERLRSLAAGGVKAAAILLVLLQILLPGGTYVLAWPLLCGAVVLRASRSTLFLALLAVPVAAVAMPVIHLLFLTTSTRLWRATLIEALILALGAVFFLVPHLRVLATRPVIALAGGAGIFGLAFASWTAAGGG